MYHMYIRLMICTDSCSLHWAVLEVEEEIFNLEDLGA